jgi:outer membrane murein-binding lipoprotein Lpp
MNTSTRSKLATAAAVMLSVTLLAGCQTVSKATGTQFAYFSADPDRVARAVDDALDSLELTTISSSATKLDGQIEARTAQGQTVEIKIKKQDSGVSKMSVKVGTLGDKTVSNAIIEGTRTKLDDD